MNDFALGLGLKRRLRATQKWAIVGRRGLPEKELEISASGKCILEDPKDGFAVDNNASNCNY